MARTLVRGGHTSGQFNLGGCRPSQVALWMAQAPLIGVAGGWGSGKSVGLCLKVLRNLVEVSYNRALVGRLNASDLRESTQQVWDEVRPTSWLRTKNKNEGIETLRNGSQVLFRHIHDPVRGRQHLASVNVAMVAVDQAEEVTERDYRLLLSRARYRTDIPHQAVFVFNPAGHNWLWRRFFQSPDRVLRGHPLFPDWDWIYVKKNSIGIAVPTKENTPEYGGYLPTGYHDMLREELSPQEVARYLDCSFEDFEGKVYPDYSIDSIHNISGIQPSPVWEYAIGIDVGGASPWAIVRVAFDEVGRGVVYDEFYKANAGVREVAEWIKADPNWSRALIVIDYENRPVMQELQQFGIYAQPARKHKLANISRVNTYFRRNPLLPHILTGELHPQGAPRLYMTTACRWTRREHDQRLWKMSETGQNLPDPRLTDHTCDALEYVLAAKTPAQPLISDPKEIRRAKLRPETRSYWEALDKKNPKDVNPEALYGDAEFPWADELNEEGASESVKDAYYGWE